MRKLNSRGITTIEVILCFVLVFIMAFSMYKTVSSYNDKRVIEKDKNEILSYKYLLTKTIQDDFVNNELSHVSIENNFDPSGKKTYILHCTLKNGTKKILKVEQTLGYSTYNPTGLKNQSDSFMISYGTEGDLVEYPLPNLGQTKIEADSSKGITEHTVQELSIQDVKIEVLEHQVLSIQIVFYHPNFGNEYGISIMAPVNYVPDINLPLTSYTLLYDDNGGSGCSDKSIHKMEDDYWGELCTPTRTNYTFLGWNTKADGTGSTFTNTEKATKNITIHAKWRKNQVHIKLNANGGSLKVTGNGYTIDADGTIKYNGSDIIHKVNYGSSLTSDGLVNWNNSSYLSLKKDGYTIDNNKVWNKKSDGSGKNFNQTTAYPASDFCNASEGDCETILYANWKMNKPSKPTITSNYEGKWTDTDVKLKFTTTTAENIIGIWYWKYNSDGKYAKWNGEDGKKTFDYTYTYNINKYLYVKVCNIQATGPNDNENCSEETYTSIKINKKPAKPIISNKYNNTWTKNNVPISITTTTSEYNIGNWYWKFDNNNYAIWSKSNGKKTLSYTESDHQNRTLYVIVCNKIASGVNDSNNCSDVASTTIKIDKKPPKVLSYYNYYNKSDGNMKCDNIGRERLKEMDFDTTKYDYYDAVWFLWKDEDSGLNTTEGNAYFNWYRHAKDGKWQSLKDDQKNYRSGLYDPKYNQGYTQGSTWTVYDILYFTMDNSPSVKTLPISYYLCDAVGNCTDNTINYNIVYYKLTYNDNDGSGCSSKHKYIGIRCSESWGTLCKPKRSGKKFKGWYTAKKGGTKITSSTVPTSSYTVYAHWENK